MNVKMIRPMFTKLVTTANMYTDYEAATFGGIIDPNKIKQGLKEYQTVIAVGSMVRDINVGDIVCINPTRYAVKKYTNSVKEDLYENTVVRYNFNMVTLDGVEHLLIDTQDVDFVVTDWDEEEKEK